MNSSKYLLEKIYLKTLTPIFIGQNQANDLSPYSDFVQDGNEIIYIDEKKFEKALLSKDGLIDNYVKSIRQKIDKSKTQSNFNLKTFIENNLGAVENFVKVKVSADQDIKHQSIKRFINTSGRPFIPGSSIKGAFRTAIIYIWLTSTDSGKNLVQELLEKVIKLSEKISELEKKKSNNTISKEEENELKRLRSKKNIENELGSIYNEQKLFGRISKDNKDGFDSRHIQISDTETFAFENLSVLKLQRIKLRDNTEVSPLPSETLNPNILGSFSFKLEKNFVKPELTKFNTFVIEDIFKILNEFSIASIEYELQSFRSFNDELMKSNEKRKTNYSNVIQFYEDLKTTIEKSNNEFAIIRLGSGKTFFDNSIGLAIFNADKAVFKQYRKLLELSKNPQTKKLVEGRFPTTRTLVEATKLPIGWMALSNKENSLKQIVIYITKIIQVENNNVQHTRPKLPKENYILAEIIDDKSKPPKVKISEGEHIDKETILPGTRLEGLGLKAGSKIYVKLIIDKKKIQKVEFKGKAE